jgi:choline-sulfatase
VTIGAPLSSGVTLGCFDNEPSDCELLVAMNGRRNDLIASEVGDDSPDVMTIPDGTVQVRIRKWH